MGRLQGKVVSIVGAAGEDNMGQVMARRFAAEGAKVSCLRPSMKRYCASSPKRLMAIG